MTDFFTIFTYTPWDNLNTNQLTEVRLLSLKSVFKKFPVIEAAFFDDLTSKVNNNNHYYWIQSIKRIVGPKNEDYDISNWNFIWALDDQRRMYQFLFQKEEGQGILVALAPPELAKLFSKHGKEAILRITSLLNDVSKMIFLMILAPQGKSIAQEQQLFHVNTQQLDKLKHIEMLKNMPNIQGQWFPTFEPRCPICNSFMTGIKDYRVGFGKLVCPNCGYEKMK